jgi:membrane-associated phospholipid phosphatase
VAAPNARRWRTHATRIHVHARDHLTLEAAREIAIAVGAYLIYFAVRGATQGNPARAIDNAHHLVDFEQWLGIFIESDVQRLVDGTGFLIDMTNWIYIWGHWPVIAVVAVWLIVYRPKDYRLVRNAFLISGGVGLVIFATFPVAPPRLADLGFVDTITDRSNAYRILQPTAFVNQYAAMPSLHLGWDLLIGIAIVAYAPWFLKVLGVLLPIGMAFAIIATANHFIIDGVAGTALALLALWAAWLIERHGAPAAPAEVGAGP